MPADLPADVTAALVQRGPTLGGHDLILLPHETRQGQTYYIDDDLDALTIARTEGLDVAFLHDGAERRYLHENAAGWELTAALAVGETLTSAGIVALSRYLWQRVRHAKKQGLYEGDEAAAPIKLTLPKSRRTVRRAT